MRVLVTGATGFLGSWLTRRLAQDGHDVSILCRTQNPDLDLQELSVKKCLGDVTDLQSLMTAARGIELVYHLAGVIGYSRAMREAMERVNVQGTANVIAACQAQNVRRLIHVSSVTAVGASFDGKVPLNEDSPYNLSHLNLGYFETKRAGEILVREAVKTGVIDAVILNPSTVYGPGDAKKGSRKTQLKVARGKLPFYTSGGVSIVAVEDVVDAIIAAGKIGRSGERYILSGENITIRQLFETIASEAGVEPPKIYLPNFAVHALGRLGDCLERMGKKGPLNSENAWTAILFHWFDSSKAQRELGFQPGTARKAIHESVAWIKKEIL